MKLRNFLTGMGSIFDIWPASRRKLPGFQSKSNEEAIAASWQAVGDDLRTAMRQADEEIDNA